MEMVWTRQKIYLIAGSGEDPTRTEEDTPEGVTAKTLLRLAIVRDEE